MHLMRYVVVLTVLVIGISFAVLNPGTMTLNYWVGSRTLPTALFCVIIFSIGCAIGLLLSAGLFLSARMASWRLSRRLKLAEKEIQNLRAIPLQDKP